MERVMEIRKNFCDFTKDDWKALMEEDERKRKEGKFLTTEEIYLHWKERYGIEI